MGNRCHGCSGDEADTLHASDLLQTLLKHRGALHARDQSGLIPLHFARNPKVIEMLVTAGAELHARDLEGASPLHHAAARRGGDSAVRTMLQHRADADMIDDAGLTPLSWALQSSTVSALLEARADPCGGRESTLLAKICSFQDGQDHHY